MFFNLYNSIHIGLNNIIKNIFLLFFYQTTQILYDMIYIIKCYIYNYNLKKNNEDIFYLHINIINKLKINMQQDN